MRVSTSQVHQQGVTAMLEQQSKLTKTQLQLATGRRIQVPSDDPTGAKGVLDLEQLIAATEQYERNADAAEARLTSEEVALNSTVDLLQRARELAVRGNTDTVNAEGRKAIASEVRQLLASLLGIANGKDQNGDYLFAGHQTDQEPFSDDGSGGYTYNGDQGQRTLQIGPTRRVEVGDAGSDVFMNIPGASQDVFSILYDLAADLDADNPDPASLNDLDAAMDNILTIQGKVGARRNAIERQNQVNESQVLQLQTTRSALQDLDYAEAVTRLNQQMVGLQAAQQSYAKVQGLSLFNFIR